MKLLGFKRPHLFDVYTKSQKLNIWQIDQIDNVASTTCNGRLFQWQLVDSDWKSSFWV